MKIRRKISPGQPGTKKFLEQYGRNLVCVRYRYDDERRLRWTTVEIVVDEEPWTPKPDPFHKEDIVSVRIGREKLRDLAIRRGVRLSNAWWNSSKGVWEMKYEQAVQLGLKAKIVKPNLSNTRNTTG